jgi:hypothetical protein
MLVRNGPPWQFKLLAPPGMLLVFVLFALGLGRTTSKGGTISPGNRRLLLWFALALFAFMEVFAWQVELRAFWRSEPLGFVAVALLLGWAIYYAARKWVAARARGQQIPAVHYEFRRSGLGLETTVTPSQPVPQRAAPAHAAPRRAPPKDTALRIRQAIVLVWAVLGLAGGLIAIILHLLRRR